MLAEHPEFWTNGNRDGEREALLLGGGELDIRLRPFRDARGGGGEVSGRNGKEGLLPGKVVKGKGLLAEYDEFGDRCRVTWCLSGNGGGRGRSLVVTDELGICCRLCWGRRVMREGVFVRRGEVGVCHSSSRELYVRVEERQGALPVEDVLFWIRCCSAWPTRARRPVKGGELACGGS